MRKLAVLAGSTVLCLGMFATVAAAGERPIGVNPLLNDARQATTLEVGGLHVAALSVDSQIDVVSLQESATARAAQRNLQFRAVTLTDQAKAGGKQVERAAPVNNLKARMVSVSDVVIDSATETVSAGSRDRVGARR